jgi:hypothetical protein
MARKVLTIKTCKIAIWTIGLAVQMDSLAIQRRFSIIGRRNLLYTRDAFGYELSLYVLIRDGLCLRSRHNLINIRDGFWLITVSLYPSQRRVVP